MRVSTIYSLIFLFGFCDLSADNANDLWRLSKHLWNIPNARYEIEREGDWPVVKAYIGDEWVASSYMQYDPISGSQNEVNPSDLEKFNLLLVIERIDDYEEAIAFHGEENAKFVNEGGQGYLSCRFKGETRNYIVYYSEYNGKLHSNVMIDVPEEDYLNWENRKGDPAFQIDMDTPESPPTEPNDGEPKP